MQIGTYLWAEEQYSYNILLTFGFVPARPEINSEEKYFVIWDQKEEKVHRKSFLWFATNKNK